MLTSNVNLMEYVYNNLLVLSINKTLTAELYIRPAALTTVPCDVTLPRSEKRTWRMILTCTIMLIAANPITHLQHLSDR